MTNVEQICERLRRDAGALLVLVMDLDGQMVAHAGDLAHVDAVLASERSAGVFAKLSGLAALASDGEMATSEADGEPRVFLAMLSVREVLMVLFDERASLEEIRSNARPARAQLAKILDGDHPPKIVH